MSELPTNDRLPIKKSGEGRVFLRGRRWCIAYFGIDARGRAVEIRESTNSKRKDIAEKLLAKRLARVARSSRRTCASNYPELYRQTKKGAKTRAIPFDLTPDDFAKIVRRARGRCELSGVTFEFPQAHRKRRPFAPSIDRVDPETGYTFKNCRLVTVIMNYAMNVWGLAPLLITARGLLLRLGRTKDQQIAHAFIDHMDRILELQEVDDEESWMAADLARTLTIGE